MFRKNRSSVMSYLMVLLISLSALPPKLYGQNTCSTAFGFSQPNQNLGYQSTTQSEMWFSAVAYDQGITITLENTTDTTKAHMHRLDVYSGSCSSTTLLASKSIVPGDSTFMLSANGLTTGNTYYIRASRDTASTCQQCTKQTAEFTIAVDVDLGYNCGPETFICNYIKNGGFERGQAPSTVAGIRNHYAECWDAQNVTTSLCGTPNSTNTPDLFDVNSSQGWGYCSQAGAKVGIPFNWMDNGVVNTRLPGTERFTHILTSLEAIDGELNATLTPGKYYFEFWYSMPQCGNNQESSYCVSLFDNSNPSQNMWIGAPVFNVNSDAFNDGQWHVAGMCVDLSNVPAAQLADYDRIQILADNAIYYFIDDISLTKLADAGHDKMVCQGSSTVIGPDCPLYSATYSWSPATGLSCTDCPNPIATPQTTTTYTVTVTATPYKDVCTEVDVVTVTVAPLPLANISGNTYKCPINNSSTFTYQVPLQANCDYQWNISNVTAPIVTQGTNSITVDWSTTTSQSSTIYVTVTDTLTGCAVMDSLNVTECCINPAPQSGPTYIDPVSSIVFPTGATSGTAYINGTLTINQNLSAVNVHWYFGTNAKVKILPGVSVRIQESVLEAGCGVMWDGIVIMDSTASLDVDASTIEDAEEAIRSDHGGQYFIHARTKLNKNHYGLVVTAYNNNHPGIIKETEITCLPSPYSTGNYLLPPLSNLRTDAGISITDVKNITIGSNVGPGDKNTFDNMNIGVHSVRSNTTVYNNEFKNIVTVNSGNVAKAAYWAEGKLLSFPPLSIANYTHTIGSNAANCKNYFTNCINGVRAETNLNVDVTNNRFSTIQSNAIVIQSCKLFNQISVKNDTILNAQAGVRLMNNNNVTAYVTNNFIEYNATPPAIAFGSYGTGVFMSQTNNMIAGAYTVSNNTLSKLKIGVQGISLNKPRVQENTITLVPGTGTFNLLRGVNLDRCYAPRITNNDISTTTATTSPQKGGIYVAASQNSLISCNDVSDIGFDIQCSGTPMTSSTIALNDLYNSRWGLMLNNSAMIGQQGTYTSPSCNTWNGTFTAGLLSANSAFGPVIYYKPSPVIYVPPSSQSINFASPWSPTPASTTSLCKGCYYKKPFVISELESQANGDYDLETAGQWMLDHAIYQMVRDDSTMLADSSSKLADFANVLDEANIGIYEQVLKTLDDPYASAQEIETARDESEGTEPQNVLEANFKTVIDIYSDMLLNESDPTAEQLDTLQVIAAKCPFTEGPAVYIARAIVAPYDTTFYINTCEMSPDSSGAKLAPQVEANEPAKAQVYPNPTEDELSVVVDLREGEVGMFEIYDTRGSKVLSQQLKAGSESKVKVAALSPGVYFYKIVVNEVEVEANKLVIIR